MLLQRLFDIWNDGHGLQINITFIMWIIIWAVFNQVYYIGKVKPQQKIAFIIYTLNSYYELHKSNFISEF